MIIKTFLTIFAELSIKEKSEMKTRHYILIALALLSTASYAQRRKPVAKKPVATVKTNSELASMTPHAKALYEDMLPNTQRVFVIDSTIVDCDKVLSAIPLPKAYGTYVDYDTFFDKQTGSKQQVFVNGFGNRCYYTELGTDSITRLYMCDRLGDGWGTPRPVKEVNDDFTDISYPYMSSDGQTLYFSGVSKTEGLGRRDIYMTKYDAEEGVFMPAENIGLPFNSVADDYAFVVADADRMAWFASTRRQPEGKACVYAFVPSEQRSNYSMDELGRNRTIDLASIKSISDTWTNSNLRTQAMAQLNKLRDNAGKAVAEKDIIYFVVDDSHTYTNINQFRSNDTRRAYYDIVRQKNDLRSTRNKIETLRAQYHNADESGRASIGAHIANLEKQELDTRASIKKAKQDLRRKESSLLKNR